MKTEGRKTQMEILQKKLKSIIINAITLEKLSSK